MTINIRSFVSVILLSLLFCTTSAQSTDAKWETALNLILDSKAHAQLIQMGENAKIQRTHDPYNLVRVSGYLMHKGLNAPLRIKIVF